MESVLGGLNLMAIGMGTVFVFLAFLVMALTFTSKLIQRLWPEEPLEPNLNLSAHTHDKVIAAISAAIHQYRTKNNQK